MSLAGCAGFGPAHFRTFRIDASAQQDAQTWQINYHGLSLHSGQIVIGDAGEPDTLLMSMLAERFSPFVHAGVVVIEKNRPYVYDAYVTQNVFMHASHGKTVDGGIRRATLEEYIRSQRIVAIYEPPSTVDAERVARFAQDRHRDGTPFDTHFDWDDHDSLYCTEFVAMALQYGGGSPPSLVAIRNNPSLHVALDWLGVRAQKIVTAESLIDSARRVALLSRNDSAAQIDAYFAAKRELHRRFTDDQRLGNIWRWTWHGLALRPNIEAFLQAARDRPDIPVAQLTVEYFSARVTDGTLPVGDRPAH